ncbi:MAG: response regulator [Gammaproteobacteria bacterium]|nr:response regulator [Gammaproteobacteria bacterium]
MAKILVVDDSRVMLEMVKASLLTEGHDVETAEDGVEALNIARTEEFDLVLSDINMPNMNGIGLVSRLRKIERYDNTPIIMLTTENSEFKKDNAKTMGANAWLQKPIDPVRLIKAINTMLAKAGHIVSSRDG